MFYYFKTIYTPAIGIVSTEFKLVKTMVDLITSFAIRGIPSESSSLVWADVKKGDIIPNVFNINNNGTSMIPLPEYSNIKVFNEIYQEAKVDLI